MKQIELLKTIFKDSPDILEPLNEIDKEIERLNKECDTYMKISTQKQKRIDKSIEYIESYLPNYDFDKTNLIKLLEILRGDKD